MKLFKNKNENESREKAAAPKEPPRPQPSVSDSEQLAASRQRAEDQIKYLENKLNTERENWSQKVRTREDEKITLDAKLEALMRKAQQEREKRESQLTLLRLQLQRELAEAEKALDSEVKGWSQRIAGKDRELEDLKHHAAFVETQGRIETEQNLRNLQAALEQETQKYKALERKMLDEQSQWIAKIKSKEDEVINLRTQISLREAQLKLESDKEQTASKEVEAARQAQIDELENKLSQQRAEWTKSFKAKEEELIAMRGALEQRVSSSKLEFEAKEQEMKDLMVKVEQRMKVVDGRLGEEKQKWAEILKVREEELGKLKIELMLRESQEKAEHEKKFQEFKDAETSASKKIKDIKQKIEEEKDIWRKNISAKEEELSGFRIQAELKLKEIQDTWEKRKNEAEREKYNLAQRLEDMKKVFEDQKILWQKEIDAKNNEIEDYQKEYQQKQDEAALAWEGQLGVLRDAKLKLEAELAGLESAFGEQKKEWQEQVSAKEKELDVYRAQLNDQESAIKKHIDAMEAQFRTEQWPLARQMKELQDNLDELKGKSSKEIAIREEQKKALQEQYSRRAEKLQLRFEGNAENIKSLAAGIKSKMDALRNQAQALSTQTQDKLAKLRDEEDALRLQLSSENEKLALEKDKVTLEYKNRRAEIVKAVETLEKQVAADAEQFKTELSRRSGELEAEEAGLKVSEQKRTEEIEVQEKQLVSAKAKGEQDIAFLMKQLADAKNEYAARLEERERQIEALKNSKKESEQSFEKDMAQLQGDYEKQMQPLADRKNELELLLSAKKYETAAALEGAIKKTEQLKQDQQDKEAAHNANIKNLNARLVQLKADFSAELTSLQQERVRIEEEYTRARAAKEQEYEKVKAELNLKLGNLEKTSEERKAQAQVSIEQFKGLVNGLQSEITRIDTEFPKQIEAKNEEIALILKQIEQKEEQYKQQTEEAEKNFESYQHRNERRIIQMQDQLAKLHERSQADITAAENKLNALRAELGSKEKEIQGEIEHEGKIYSEEKYKLEKQKTELEEKLADTQMRSREQLRQKEKEILAAQSELATREKAWEQAWKQKEQEFNSEKALLLQEIDNLNTRVKDEEATASRRISEKETEIANFQNQHSLKMQSLVKEMSEKKHQWEETVQILTANVGQLDRNLQELHRNWEQSKTQKEKELAVLKSNLEFWELRMKNEEEKRVGEWEDERVKLESRIKEIGNDLKRNEIESAVRLEEKEKKLNAVKEESRKTDEDKTAQYKVSEAIFQDKRTKLTAEIDAREAKYRQESSEMDKEIKDIGREIEKLKLESALKDTTAQSGRQKAEREWVKLQRKLKDQLAVMGSRLNEEKTLWLSKLQLKEEEINTLQVRLSMREDRRQAEIKRREEDIARITAELDASLKFSADKYDKRIPDQRKEVEYLRQELAAMRSDVEGREKLWQEEQSKRQGEINAVYSELSGDLDKLENELKSESRRLEDLMKVKEKQVENLSMRMKVKEETLKVEREHTQEIISALKNRTAEFNSYLKRSEKSAKPGKEKSLMERFESAIAAYNTGDFEQAKNGLSEIIQAQSDFAGAHQYLALCWLKLGDKLNAKNEAQRALELEPHNEELKNWINTL